MTGWQIFVALDFATAVGVAFVAGYLWGKPEGYKKGYRAGITKSWHWAVDAEQAEPTVVTGQR